jgi:hypothetical protein
MRLKGYDTKDGRSRDDEREESYSVLGGYAGER